MRYQSLIIERIRQGLVAISPQVAETFVQTCSPPINDLPTFVRQVNAHFVGLLASHGVTVGKRGFDIPEDDEAIPYWVEDLERRVHPVLKAAKEKQDGSESAVA
ncbi:hypothetical protein PHOBOS_206 [Erwinia phage vB_EamM_Phobos]|uniref:hypothetical protein n=1 Tax=Erwinia phage vB_EamM_Phobos TaxID=1883377 RepID=UPI00081C3BA8|nr:hypothetical protein BIZ79_gp206 [Erwinia phage vB_EamM_Phobos]ANZ50396.1 hypothetical protein PHOBOS_206 [Erwinia phage vB_EamM_Phobos]